MQVSSTSTCYFSLSTKVKNIEIYLIPNIGYPWNSEAEATAFSIVIHYVLKNVPLGHLGSSVG